MDMRRGLLGKGLYHVLPDGQLVGGVITETEAYLGAEDPACHTFGYRRTSRTETMYAQGGLAYVYFIYGMYNCFNVVSRPQGEPEAALVRAIWPTEGIEYMRRLRPHAKRIEHLADGPGKLCMAMGIDRHCDGLDLTGARLFIGEGLQVDETEIEDSPRIGIDYAGDAAQWPLRFRLLDSSSPWNHCGLEVRHENS